MQLKVNAVELASTLQAATAASAQASGGLIELEVNGKQLTVRGTDGELFVRRTVAVEDPVVAGKAAVAGRALLGLVRESGGSEVVLETAAEKLRVRCGPGRYEILCAVGPALPEPPSVADGGTCIEAPALVRLLELTAFAASSREMRYAMNGVCLSTKGKVLSAAAVPTSSSSTTP